MSTIPNNLRADIFRQRIENKNTLSNRGGLYIGTGQSFGSGSSIIYVTDQLVPGANHSVFGVASGSIYGVGYINGVGANFFANDAITKSKISVIQNGAINDSKISGKIASTKITGISFTTDASGNLYIQYN